jgi:hypothetical protein
VRCRPGSLLSGVPSINLRKHPPHQIEVVCTQAVAAEGRHQGEVGGLREQLLERETAILDLQVGFRVRVEGYPRVSLHDLQVGFRV